MQDFLDHLDEQLALLVAVPELRAPAVESRERRRRHPFIAGSLAALITGAGVFALTGTSTAELPILDTPTTDASSVRDRVAAAKAAGVDFAAAHRFGTAGGPGYVLENKQTNAICVVVPDPGVPGQFGGSCSPRAAAERDGLAAEFPGDLAINPEALTHFVFVLPDGAEDVHLLVGSRRSSPAIESGVVALALPDTGRLRWVVDGKPGERLIEGPFSAGGAVQTLCADGRSVRIDGIAPDATPAEMRPARKAACAR